MKIAIIGYSGSGKSTLAKKLAEWIGCEPLYLDTVQFLPNWVERDRAESREIVRRTLEKDAWVIDGNYRSFLFKERMMDADEIVFMNYPRLVCLCRAVKRYRQFRGRTRDSIASGCIEKLDREFVKWILYKGRTKERVGWFLDVVRQYPEKTVVIRNDRELGAYLSKKKIPLETHGGQSYKESV